MTVASDWALVVLGIAAWLAGGVVVGLLWSFVARRYKR